MKVLAWLAFPVGATVLAGCWAAWRESGHGSGRRLRTGGAFASGPRLRTGGAFASVEEFRRFRDALAAPASAGARERRTGLPAMFKRIAGHRS